MPKIKLLEDQAVVDLIEKRVAQSEASAEKAAARRHRGIVASVKSAIAALDIPAKERKPISAAVLAALDLDAPAQAE